MPNKQPSLMEVLFPRRFAGNVKRSEATRTILQPELDRYELAEADASGRPRCGTPLPTSTASDSSARSAA